MTEITSLEMPIHRAIVRRASLSVLIAGVVAASSCASAFSAEAAKGRVETSGEAALRAAESAPLPPRRLSPQAAALHHRADAAVCAGNMNEAARLYTQAALFEPRDPLLRLLIGICLTVGASENSETARKNALMQFRAAARLSEDDLLASLLLRSALYDNGAIEEANIIWMDAARRYSRDTTTAGRSGKNGLDVRRSLERLRGALAAFPKSPIFHLLIGDAHQLAEEYDRADDAYERAIALAPRWTKPRINLGVCRLAQNRLNEAIEIFTRVQTLDPRNTQAQLSMADAQLQAGNPQGAAQTYRLATANSVGKGGVLPQALTGLGQSLIVMNKPAEAIKTLNRAQRLAPRDPAPPAAIARAQMQMGNYRESAQSLQLALRLTQSGGLFEERAVLYRALIESQMFAKRPMDALETARRALVDEPGDAPLWHRLAALVYFEMNNTRDGQNSLRAALDAWISQPATAPLYPQEIVNALAAHKVMDTAEAWYLVQRKAEDDGERAVSSGRNGFGGGANTDTSRTVRGSASRGAGRVGVAVLPSNSVAATPVPPVAKRSGDAKDERRALACVALAHLARQREDTDSEVRLRAQAVELRGRGADWYLLAETHDLRRGDLPQARYGYERALALGGLPDGVADAIRKRLRVLKAVDRGTPPPP